MTGFQFAMLAWFGVPIAIVGMLVLAYRLMPEKAWKSWPLQTVATLGFLSAIGVPVAITWIDAQGDYFDDRNHLVRGGLSTPPEAEVAHKRFNKLGNCWSNAVNWSVEARFSSQEKLNSWFEQEPWKDSLVDQMSGYFDLPRDQITVEEGALSPAMRDAKWVWDEQGRIPDWISRTYRYITPFVCTAIDGETGPQGSLNLRRCDPIALPKDTGNLGRVTIMNQGQNGILEGHIHYLSGPSYCTNPLRRGLNGMLGLPHPEGEVDSNIGGAIPS
ncbi:hypothetical protein [Altererythrobacter lutimaris]|uniref:Uncharacterized protein n=1 Tax=Altererythrobacter lutimaris TaxID=2743979 RepID=A0A850HBD7_9SPHN|nr:hypothetical protein [Altererythrobacter lutimaris]NVE94565.1 hypothetical protein [Altererythrobacter lutimaris]